MRSLFHAPAFGSAGLPTLGRSLGTVRLAQTDTTTPVSPDSDVSALTGGIEGFLKQLPPELLGTYNAKYQQCQSQLSTGGAVGLAAGAKCLAQLYGELKDLFRNGPPKPAAPASTQDFPVGPAILGVVSILVLVWGLSKLSSNG
jgi:hypothetical protein